MGDGFWVFGYGSLIWRTGFPYAERRIAVMEGYRRSFCMTSHHYRGTPEKPGLVLALNPEAGASCRGMAFQVHRANEAEVMDYLRGRELISDAYLERHEPIRFEDGSRATAVCYVINRDHEQYAGELTLDRKAGIIAGAAGSAGANRDYLFSTWEALEGLGIRDAELEALVALLRERFSS